MEKASEILGRALRRMDNPQAAQTWLRSTWTSLVGKTMAAHIQPSACANGVLRIEADSRQWQEQAKTMGKEICERLNHSWGGTLVKKIHVERAMGSKKRLAHEIDNEHIPFVRRKPAHQKS